MPGQLETTASVAQKNIQKAVAAAQWKGKHFKKYLTIHKNWNLHCKGLSHPIWMGGHVNCNTSTPVGRPGVTGRNALWCHIPYFYQVHFQWFQCFSHPAIPFHSIHPISLCPSHPRLHLPTPSILDYPGIPRNSIPYSGYIILISVSAHFSVSTLFSVSACAVVDWWI